MSDDRQPAEAASAEGQPTEPHAAPRPNDPTARAEPASEPAEAEAPPGPPQPVPKPSAAERLRGLSLALIEVSNLSPTFVVADRMAKAAGVEILAIESTDGSAQCIKLVGRTDDVTEAAAVGRRLAESMGATCDLAIIAAPEAATFMTATLPPNYSPLLETYDARVPRETPMNDSDAIGLLETQGLVAALHATDAMLKAANVKLIGKEKIGAAYVTIMIRGDVAAVQAAIETGQQMVGRLGGKLIMADVISRPHKELAALLPG